nr:uncharacterized protein LOC106037961 isoform X10 [Anser cygnoides]
MPAMRRGIPSVWGLEGCGLMVHVSLRAWNRALVPTRTKAALCSLLLQPERANPGASPHVPLGAGPWASCKQASPFTFIQHYQFKWILKEYSAGGAGTSGEPSALLPLSGRCALQRDSRPRASCARGLWVLAPLWFSFHFPLHAEVTGRAARRRAAVGARGASCPHLTPGSAAGPGRPQLAQAAQEEPQAVTRHPAALLPLELGTAGGAGSWGGAGGCSIPVSPLLPFLEPQLCQELFNYTLELLLWRGDVVRVPCKPEPARDRPGHQQEHTARMEPAKPPPSKRMAPAPPVPAKTKPALGLPSKPSSPQPGTSAEMERGRAGDPDTDGFSALQVTTAKLSHPTATRPRVPGRRLPSMAGVGLGPPCAELCPHLPAAGQGPEQRLALEDLKAEVRSLHILVDLMRGQHLRDLEDVRLELQHERTKREALQVRPPWPWDTRTPPTHPQCPTNPPAPFSSLQAEIERVRKALPC